jgi:hypothetical protein
LLAKQPDPRLAAFVVWVPKLFGHESDVPNATRFVYDSRAQHFWDDSAVLVHRYDTVLGLGQDAWDIYMIYGPEARWDGSQPPAPSFWMHQLHLPSRSGISGSFLNPAVFAAAADSSLRTSASSK